MSRDSNVSDCLCRAVVIIWVVFELSKRPGDLDRVRAEISHAIDEDGELKLSYNSITTIPSSIASASRLQVLYIDHNHVEELCEGLFSCLNLSMLRLDHNQLKQLPMVSHYDRSTTPENSRNFLGIF